MKWVLEHLKVALNAAQMGVWTWDLDQQYEWSPQAEHILGDGPGTVAHRYDDWAKRLHPGDRPRAEAAMDALRQAVYNGNHNCSAVDIEYRFQLPNGQYRWIEAQGQMVQDPEHSSPRVVGVIQDITERKQSVESLEASEARFRAVFEQAAVGMARLAPDGRWIQVNQTLCRFLGYTADELLQLDFRQVTDPQDREVDAHQYQSLLDGEVESCRFEKRYRHKSGHSLWALVTVSKEYDDDGQLLCFIAVIENIQARKEVEQELQQQVEQTATMNLLLAQTTAMLEERNSELNQFAYVASHDLKAPLRAIANLSEWIEEDLQGQLPSDNERQLQLLRNRVHRMEGLIDGLLAYSRVGQGDRLVKSVDVSQLLDEVIDSLAPPSGFRIIRPDTLPIFETQPIALRQVFANLIGNAIKHHDQDEGHITITVADQDTAYEFAVADDGPGIDPRYHDKAFVIFQTLKARDEVESTGIGLAIVKKIIESEGGTIHLESSAGNGCTFRFIWPK